MHEWTEYYVCLVKIDKDKSLFKHRKKTIYICLSWVFTVFEMGADPQMGIVYAGVSFSTIEKASTKSDSLRQGLFLSVMSLSQSTFFWEDQWSGKVVSVERKLKQIVASQPHIILLDLIYSAPGGASYIKSNNVWLFGHYPLINTFSFLKHLKTRKVKTTTHDCRLATDLISYD